ncbi:MAG: histidine phosphatase family protein [Chloroflexi bacterium]|nr:histidine phosphatase family protein [Chloroflexota bacterium]
MKVYFVTHSTSKDNEVGLASGWKDIQLSQLGIQQARELGDRFENIDVDLICCSDLVRAVETVRIAFGKRIRVSIDKRLREINYGDFNGKPAEIVSPMNNKWIKEPFPNGESYEQAIARIHDFCRELKTNHVENVILIVGHRATKFGLDTLAGNKTLEECLSTPHKWQPYWEYEL